MKIKLFYDDELIEGKIDYSCRTVTVDSWDRFWQIWKDDEEFVKCDDEEGTEVYLKKDRVIELGGNNEI